VVVPKPGGPEQVVKTTVAVEEAWGQAAVAVLETVAFFEFGYVLKIPTIL